MTRYSAANVHDVLVHFRLHLGPFFMVFVWKHTRVWVACTNLSVLEFQIFVVRPKEAGVLPAMLARVTGVPATLALVTHRHYCFRA